MVNKNYKTQDPQIDRKIEELAETVSSSECRDRVREILTTVMKMSLEHNNVGDFKLINRAFKELRHSFRIFSPYRTRRKVAVFGSSRTHESDPNYTLASDLSDQLVEKGFMIITGAGGGIMEAANRGAGRKESFGVNINLPFEQEANPYIVDDPKLINFKFFFTRKLIFIKESHATVLLPGGFGTLDEGMENLTLFQTGKCHPRPIIFLETENGNYWSKWQEFIHSVLIKGGYISPEDHQLFQICHSAEDAVERIQNYYRVFHSLRYVGEQTVIRLNHKIPNPLISRLNDEFKDIIADGTIQASGPLADEMKNQEFIDLPRLVFQFDKHSFGRLNEMIHTLNGPEAG